MDTSGAAQPTRYLTVKQYASEHSWPTEGGLRHLIFEGAQNGFNACVRKVGRRILLNEASVLDWIERQTLGD